MNLPLVTKTVTTIAISFLFVSTLYAELIEPTASELGLMKGFPPPIDKVVDATNWTLPPYNRWGFQNVNRFQPTGHLDNGPSERQAPWLLNKKNLDHLEISTPDGETMSLRALMEMYLTDALVVIHDGKLIYERYWNGMTPQSQHWMASTSKSIIGTAAAILIDRGIISREDPVTKYLPELSSSGFNGTTVDQLLDMTAGTAWDESMDELQNPDSFARQYGAASGSWKIRGVDSNGVWAFLPSIEAERKHGESFAYNTPLVDVMGWILARATGKTLEQTVSDEFWSSLGAESPAYYLLDTAGNAWATGGMSATARDLARFGLLMLQEGQIHGYRVFPQTVARDIMKNGDKQVFATGSHADLYPNGSYRNYWWIKNDEDRAYLAKGIFGQYIYVNPAKRTVIVRFASEKTSADRTRMLRVEHAFKKIATYLDAADRQ